MSWAKYCKCGRGILATVAQCSHCDELDARHACRKAVIQHQRSLNYAPVAELGVAAQRTLAGLLNQSFYVSYQNSAPKHLASYQREQEHAEFIQALLGGYVFDQSLWDYADGPRHGWQWHSRDRDLYELIPRIWPLLGPEKQLYLIERNLHP